MPEHFYATEGHDHEQLLEMGFSETEATRLIHMKDHVTEQVEYREMVEESRRLGFIRWLIENNRMSK